MVLLPFGLVNFLANYGIPVFPTGSLGNILLVGLWGYAAVRHRLMDIDVFIMRAAAAVLASVVLVLPFAATVIWVQQLPIGGSILLVVGCLLLAALASLFGFSRLRSFLEQQMEMSLFPTRHAARDAVRQLSADLLKFPQRADLYAAVTSTLVRSMGVGGAALYLRNDGRSFEPVHHAGTVETPKEVTYEPFVAAVGEGTALADGAAAVVPSWDACVAVRVDGTATGFLALTPKLSGGAFDDSDVTLLGLVAAQLGVALKHFEYLDRISTQTAEIEDLQNRLAAEQVAVQMEVRTIAEFDGIVGASPALHHVLSMVSAAAPTNASILILGETGTGKELIARAIHELSPRRNGPLVNVNCPAIPAGLAENELFGHERGAFTGAVDAYPGKFELADGGTIFLDEIGELSVDLQVKLLRVLQAGEVQRIGSRKVRTIDARIVAATNRDLRTEMRDGRFREDLFYRLATVELHMPPLRERTGDIAMLATYFLERAVHRHRKPIEGFTAEALAALNAHRWPGNVRELEHVIERAVVLCTGTIIKADDLPAAGTGTPARTHKSPLRLTIRAEKLKRAEAALAQTGGNRAAAARLLGMTPSNFSRLLKNLGVKPAADMQ